MKNIPVAKPIIDRHDVRAVVKVMKSGGLAQGPEVSKFESLFAEFVSDRSCVAVNSGTSALHLALLALGVGPGDEVIVPSFTFAATANSVALTGAKPVFVDINPRTYNLDPNLIEAAITQRTRAIQVVHLYGLPADMEVISTIAKKHNLLIIEDAAQAHLAAIKGQPVGTFGDAAAFSFYPTKNMTAGEGGMIVLKNPDQARICKLLRNQGMEQRYQNEVIGFNLRMTDIHAAIGISQLRKVKSWTTARQENALFLNQKIEEVVTPYIPNDYSHVFHQYTVRVKSKRDLFSKKLGDLGIGNSVYYPTQVHKLPSFNLDLQLRHTEDATNQVVSLPVHPSLSKRDLIRIAEGVNRVGASLK
jgi:dTDP-4-amino-4,6-dideoxygalactose transaminase